APGLLEGGDCLLEILRNEAVAGGRDHPAAARIDARVVIDNHRLGGWSAQTWQGDRPLPVPETRIGPNRDPAGAPAAIPLTLLQPAMKLLGGGAMGIGQSAARKAQAKVELRRNAAGRTVIDRVMRASLLVDPIVVFIKMIESRRRCVRHIGMAGDRRGEV